VLAQFTIEAVILSTVGGLFGILLSWGTLVVTALTPLQAVISPVAFLLVFVVPAAVLPALTPSLP